MVMKNYTFTPNKFDNTPIVHSAWEEFKQTTKNKF